MRKLLSFDQSPEEDGRKKMNLAHYFWLGCLVFIEAVWAIFLIYLVWRLMLWAAHHFGIAS